jgi:hypothetical protein
MGVVTRSASAGRMGRLCILRLLWVRLARPGRVRPPRPPAPALVVPLSLADRGLGLPKPGQGISCVPG